MLVVLSKQQMLASSVSIHSSLRVVRQGLSYSHGSIQEKMKQGAQVVHARHRSLTLSLSSNTYAQPIPLSQQIMTLSQHSSNNLMNSFILALHPFQKQLFSAVMIGSHCKIQQFWQSTPQSTQQKNPYKLAMVPFFNISPFHSFYQTKITFLISHITSSACLILKPFIPYHPITAHFSLDYLITQSPQLANLQQIDSYYKKSTKMADYGYDKERFPNMTGDMFDCPICTNVVILPKECMGCGDLYCGKCIDDWMKKNNSCPKRCSGPIQPLGKALMKIYNDQDIKCSFCPKVLKICDLVKHESICKRAKCWNQQICSGYEHESKVFGPNCCSEQCQLLDGILKTGGNAKKMYDILIKYAPKNLPVEGVLVPQGPVLVESGVNSILWDQTKCGLGLQFQNKGQLVILKQPAYVFRTCIATVGFSSGQHYWEIIPDARTENELKVGVTTSASFDLNTAFCDHIFGYAYYGLGQLRQNSNASGSQYGKRMKKQGVLGVFLNMDRGQLSFSLNGQNMGVAFDNVALKKGPIYPAVALLHCAGCSIKGELPIPNCFK